MSVGVTGTRNPLTLAQRTAMEMMLSAAMASGDTEIHHGACVGADAAAHVSAVARSMTVFVHPPVNERLMMDLSDIADPRQVSDVRVLPAKDYHSRNRDIVDSSNYVIAFPDGPRRPHSGTWYTIDYAVRNGKPVYIVYPDGSIKYPDGTDVPLVTGEVVA